MKSQAFKLLKQGKAVELGFPASLQIFLECSVNEDTHTEDLQ